MIKQKNYFNLTIILIALYVIFIFGASQLYINYISKYNKFLRVPNNLEVVNLGSSHSFYGIKYPKGIKGYNLALDSQNFYYDSKILKKYINKINKNGKIIIPVSIFSFYSSDDLGDTDLNERYYNFLNYEDVYNGTKTRAFLVKKFYIFYDGKSLFGTLKFIVKSLIKRKLEYKEMEWPSEKLTLAQKIKESEETVKRHTRKTKVHMEYIKNILKICKENNLIPILITTPQSYLYNEGVGDNQYKERIYDKIERLKEEFNFIYLDYSHDQRFENNLELFYDDDHLNEKGAEIFTDILLKDIEKKFSINFKEN